MFRHALIVLTLTAAASAQTFNRAVDASSLRIRPASDGSGLVLTGQVLYHPIGGSGDISGHIAVFLDGTPISWTGGSGNGGTCSPDNHLIMGPGIPIGPGFPGGPVMYICDLFCTFQCTGADVNQCIPPSGVPQANPMCLCNQICLRRLPPGPGSLPDAPPIIAAGFAVPLPGAPLGSSVTVRVDAALGALLEADVTDDVVASSVADLLRCTVADQGAQGGASGPDGTLDNNDFVIFIDRFFSGNPAADLGIQGGLPGSDGLFDNNDFVAFIDAFFTGC